MIEEAKDFGIGEIEDDANLGFLFSGVVGVAPMHVEENKDPGYSTNYQQKKSDNWSDIDFRDEVYSERPLSKRKRIRKVQRRAWKNLKKTRNDTYIKMLESKVQNLEKELCKQKAINKTNQDYIKKLNLSEQIISGVFVGRSQIYDRLEDLTEQPDTDDVRKQIIKQLSTLRYRLGVFGKDRIKALNHYFKQMVESFIPECQKFLVHIACKELDFFSEEYIQRGTFKYSKDEIWREEIMKSVHLNYQQRKTISNFKQSIVQEQSKYDQLVHQFLQMKKQLTQQAKRLQIIFDGFRAFMTPYQVSKILVHIEKNKYRKEMNLDGVDDFWAQQLEEGENVACAQSVLASTTDAGNWI